MVGQQRYLIFSLLLLFSVFGLLESKPSVAQDQRGYAMTAQLIWLPATEEVSKSIEVYPAVDLVEPVSIQMATSPDGGALELVLAVIAAAKKSIYIVAYSFTNKTIARALVEKYRRGITVQIVLDQSQQLEKHSLANFVANNGVPVRINSRYAALHSKLMVIDEETIETGSFNFTNAAAKRNSENVLVVWHYRSLAQQYLAYWQRLWDEAEPYQLIE